MLDIYDQFKACEWRWDLQIYYWHISGYVLLDSLSKQNWIN